MGKGPTSVAEAQKLEPVAFAGALGTDPFAYAPGQFVQVGPRSVQEVRQALEYRQAMLQQQNELLRLENEAAGYAGFQTNYYGSIQTAANYFVGSSNIWNRHGR